MNKKVIYLMLLAMGVALAHPGVFSNQGGISQTYSDFLLFVYGGIRVICVLTGAGLCLGSVIQYRQYRNNPVSVKLSMPIWMLIIGLLLIGLPQLPSDLRSAYLQSRSTVSVL